MIFFWTKKKSKCFNVEMLPFCLPWFFCGFFFNFLSLFSPQGILAAFHTALNSWSEEKEEVKTWSTDSYSAALLRTCCCGLACLQRHATNNYKKLKQDVRSVQHIHRRWCLQESPRQHPGNLGFRFSSWGMRYSGRSVIQGRQRGEEI